jgi:hypothetical protein
MTELSSANSLLLDTNIVTYTKHNTTWKEDYLPILYGKELCIGFMTVAELLESVYPIAA